MAWLKVSALTITLTLLNGWALMWLWAWFITPTFSVTTISLAQAIGISLLADLLTAQHIPRNDNEMEEFYFFSFFMPVFIIVLGFLVHLFM